MVGLPQGTQSGSNSAICSAPMLLASGRARPHIAQLSISIRCWSRRKSQAPAQSPWHPPPPTNDEISLWPNLAAGTGGAPHTRCDPRHAKVVPKGHAVSTPDRQGRRLRTPPGMFPEPALVTVPVLIASDPVLRGNRQKQPHRGAKGTRSLHQPVLRERPTPRPYQRRAAGEDARDPMSPLSPCLNDSSALRVPHRRPSRSHNAYGQLKVPNPTQVPASGTINATGFPPSQEGARDHFSTQSGDRKREGPRRQIWPVFPEVESDDDAFCGKPKGTELVRGLCSGVAGRFTCRSELPQGSVGSGRRRAR